MQVEIKKTPEGYLARKIKCDPWFRCKDQMRVGHDGKPIMIQQWINPEDKVVLWILDRLCMSMLRSRNCDYTELRSTDRGNDDPIWVSYERPVMLVCTHFTEAAHRTYLLNAEGKPLAGSNIYAEGGSLSWSLCLGQSFNVFTINPVELLIQNEANGDLEWMGGTIEGQLSPNQDHFHISLWPSSGRILWQPPRQIIESLNALSQPS